MGKDERAKDDDDGLCWALYLITFWIPSPRRLGYLSFGESIKRTSKRILTTGRLIR